MSFEGLRPPGSDEDHESGSQKTRYDENAFDQLEFVHQFFLGGRFNVEPNYDVIAARETGVHDDVRFSHKSGPLEFPDPIPDGVCINA